MAIQRVIRSTVLGISVLISAFSCRTNNVGFETEAPFTVVEADFQYETDAISSDEGIRLTFLLSGKDHCYALDSAYFRGNSAKLQKVSDAPLVFTAFFKKEKEDRILDRNPLLESQNRIPRLDSSFPFDLQPHEAVLTYRKDNERIQFKLVNIKAKPMQKAPNSIPQNN